MTQSVLSGLDSLLKTLESHNTTSVVNEMDTKNDINCVDILQINNLISDFLHALDLGNGDMMCSLFAQNSTKITEILY